LQLYGRFSSGIDSDFPEHETPQGTVHHAAAL